MPVKPPKNKKRLPGARGARLRDALRRAVDANFNRAREGLRVAEDVARFFWRNRKSAQRIKNLRHRLTALEKSLGGALRAREVSADVGRFSWSAGEKKRRDIRHVFQANLRRTQEALRCLEEFLKLEKPSAAKKAKRLRFACYALEEDFF